MSDLTGSEGVGPRSAGLNESARDIFPGGVSSPVRAFRGVGGEPPVMRRAMGALLTDVDGRIYVDLIGSWGPMVVGHGHPEVLNAVQERIKRGVSTGTPSPDEVRLGPTSTAGAPRPPDRVIRLKTTGISPGLWMEDGKGHVYLFKFVPGEKPAQWAEAISRLGRVPITDA